MMSSDQYKVINGSDTIPVAIISTPCFSRCFDRIVSISKSSYSIRARPAGIALIRASAS